MKYEDEIVAHLRIDPRDELAGVDEVVRAWGQEQIRYAPLSGYPTHDTTCRHAVSSVQWETTDELNEMRLRRMRVQACEGAMGDMTCSMERAVIWQVYANAVGPSVWRTGPLKGWSKERIRALLLRALTHLRAGLRRRGVDV